MDKTMTQNQLIMSTLIFKLIQMIYASLLRELIEKAVNDPSSDWDELLMQRLDALFGYDEK